MSSQVTLPQTNYQQTPEVNTARPSRPNIWDSAVLLSLTRKWPALSKTVKSSVVQTTADKRRVHASKDLFNSTALRSLFSYDLRIDDFISRRTSPFPLKRGVYLLPVDLFNEVENQLTKHAEGRIPLIQACYDAYDTDLEEAQQSLGDLFDLTDYLTKNQFRECFTFEWQYVQMAVSEKLTQISAEIASREANKMAQKWIEAGQAAETVLYASFSELVNHLKERLTPEIDPTSGTEKRKVIRDTMFDNLGDFLRTLKSRNLTGNENMNALADQAKALVTGITPTMLKSNEAMRESILQGFSQIKETLDKAVQEKPIRAVRFED